jgi:hydrogenase maturation protease
MSELARRGTVVIGLGNPIMGDDGFGLAVLRRLQQQFRIPADVELVDGGTWGLTLLPIFESAERVLLLDAIETGAEPGTLWRVEREQLPARFALRTSPHQIDLCDILAIMRLRGSLTAEMVAIGAQPGVIDMTTSLSPAVEAVVSDAVMAAIEQLQVWGHDCRADGGQNGTGHA